jgi:mannitol operon transcriptional antiterminator
MGRVLAFWDIAGVEYRMKEIKIDFSSRMQQILKILLNQEGAVPVKLLADQMGISKRTVQRELESVARPLKKYGLEFCSKAGSGVWLEGETADKAELLSRLEAEDGLDITDKAERRKRLVLEILRDKTVKKLYYYSQLFGVSEATISTDLESAEGWLSDFGLKVVRKPGLGICIEGREGNFRQALRAFIGENMNSAIIRNLYTGTREDGGKSEELILSEMGQGSQILKLAQNQSNKNIYRVLDEGIMRRVVSSLHRVTEKRLRNLTEQSYTGLVIHVTIAVNRILNQELMEENPKLLEHMERDEDFQLAGEIIRQLEQEFQVSIPQEETAYICLHLKGAKVQQYEGDSASREMIKEYRELWVLVNEMIDRYDPEIAYALKQDEEFVVWGLVAHLQPTLVRLSNHMTIQNPLLEHIKTEYHEIYERCTEVAKVIQERYGYEVPEAEIGFLAIHFGAALVRLENRHENKRKVLIGVVCASGIGISRLMVSKLDRYFSDRAEIQAFGTFDLNPYVLERLDFLISTLPLQEEIESILVSPLLTDDDIERIRRRVVYYERMPKKQSVEDGFTRQLEQVNFIATQIKRMIQEMGYLLVSPEISFQELLLAVSEMLSPYHDRRHQIQEDLKKRERLGSQVFAQFGFALLHAKTKGVGKPSFSVCQTKGFHPFQDAYFQGISVVIVMLLPEDEHIEENRQILGFLSETLVEEYEFLETVSGGSKEEIQSILSKYLKKFFNQYLDRVS